MLLLLLVVPVEDMKEKRNQDAAAAAPLIANGLMDGGCCWSLMICPCGICPVRVVWSISVLMDFFFLVRLSQTVCVGVIWSSLLERLNGCACGLGTEAMMICDTFPSTPSFSLSLSATCPHIYRPTQLIPYRCISGTLSLSLSVFHTHTLSCSIGATQTIVFDAAASILAFQQDGAGTAS